MKIQPIFYNYNRINQNSNKIGQNETLSKTLTSFTSRILSYEEVKPYKLKAYELKQKSQENLIQAKNIQLQAQRKVDCANEAYQYALQVAREVIKNPKAQRIELGKNYATFKFKIENNGFAIDIRVFDENDKRLRDIFVQNLKVKSVLNYADDTTGTIYQFGNDNCSISENMALKGTNAGSCDAHFNFINNELALCKINATFENPQKAQKTFYFKDDKLVSCDVDEQLMLPVFFMVSLERFMYQDEQLVNHLSNFHKTSKGITSWEEGYHFRNGSFVGHSEKTLQPVLGENLTCENAIFKVGDDFVESDSSKLSFDISKPIEFFN